MLSWSDMMRLLLEGGGLRVDASQQLAWFVFQAENAKGAISIVTDYVTNCDLIPCLITQGDLVHSGPDRSPITGGPQVEVYHACKVKYRRCHTGYRAPILWDELEYLNERGYPVQRMVVLRSDDRHRLYARLRQQARTETSIHGDGIPGRSVWPVHHRRVQV